MGLEQHDGEYITFLVNRPFNMAAFALDLTLILMYHLPLNCYAEIQGDVISFLIVQGRSILFFLGILFLCSC